MTLPTFGIPDDQAAFTQLAEAVQSNDSLLEPVVNAAGNALLSQVKANDAALSKASSTASKSLSARVGANSRSLSQVSQAAEGTLAGYTASQGAVLASVPPTTPPLPIVQPGGPGNPCGQGPSIQPPPPKLLPGQSLFQYCQSIGVFISDGPPPGVDFNTWLRGELLAPTEGTNPNAPYNIVTIASDNSGTWYANTCNAYNQFIRAGIDQTLPPEPLPVPEPLPPEPVPITGQCIPICGVGSSSPPLSPPPPPGGPPPSPPPSLPPSGGSPPPPTIPPAPPVIPPQPAGATFDLIIPIPGTIEWCQAADKIYAFFVDIGSRFLSWVNDSLANVESFLLSIGQPPPDTDWSVFGTIWTGILRDFVAPSAQLAANIIHGWRNIISVFNSGWIAIDNTKIPIAVGITAFRVLWAAVKNWEIGSDVYTANKTKLGEALPEIDRILEYLNNQLIPIEVPHPPEAMEALLQGQITREIYECWLYIHGCHPAVFEPVLRSRRDRLQTAEAIQYVRRNGGDVNVQIATIQSLGWYNQDEAAQRVYLYDELPTIADHLHWLQRNVFDAAYVQEFALMEGFEEKFWPAFGQDLYSQGMKKEYAALHYAAHWLNPAPEQLKEMVYRLRPEKYGPQLSFTSEQYARVLAEQDVGPFFRPRFQEIIYRVPALGYLRDMYRQYIITDEDMKGYHLDLGYSERDSQRFVAIDSIVRARMRATEAHGWNPAAIANAYSIRRLTPEQVIELMDGLGYYQDESMELMERADAELTRSVFMRARSRALTSTVTEVRKAIQVGTVSPEQAEQMLVAAGWPQDYASNLAASESVSAHTDLVKQIVASVRKAYLRGEVPALVAQQTLMQAGILAAGAADYLALWALQLTPTRKRRTGSQIVNDVASGNMTTDEALARLINLGYDDADSRLYMADAQSKIAKRQAQMLASQQRADKAAQATLAKLARQAQVQARAAIKRLEKIAPVAKLQKWAKLGIIGHDLFLARMKLYGYDLLTAEDYYKEACSGKTANCTETTPPGTTIGTGVPGSVGP